MLEDVFGHKDTVHGYCLQPVVVRKKDMVYRVIDGQQRLTTIRLILEHLKGVELKENPSGCIKTEEKESMGIDPEKTLFKITFERRDNDFMTESGKKDFLGILDNKTECDKDIDLYHLHKAYERIQSWFEGKASQDVVYFKENLLNAFVIWYEVADSEVEEDVFTRLNAGKIPLTNAELIRALFLSRPGQSDGPLEARQLILAKEWDDMEQMLQQPQFWYFLIGKSKFNKSYETRIDFIFDNLLGKGDTNDPFYTFFEIKKCLEEGGHDKAIANAAAKWLKIKQYFQMLEGWYQDHETYHLVGYLTSVGVSLEVIAKYAEGVSKSAFKKELRAQALASLKNPLETLDYEINNHKEGIKNTLLLLNVLTIVKYGLKEMRFSFESYHKDNWDIEHIHSVTQPDNEKERKKWAKMMYRYFTGHVYEKQPKFESEDVKNICELLVAVINEEKSLTFNDNFVKAYKAIELKLNIKSDLAAINGIGNLTLLDRSMNRGYKNAPFPVKRQWIIDREKRGGYILLCTRNIFTKAYSNNVSDFMNWNEQDADDYRQAITDILELIPNE